MVKSSVLNWHACVESNCITKKTHHAVPQPNTKTFVACSCASEPFGQPVVSIS